MTKEELKVLTTDELKALCVKNKIVVEANDTDARLVFLLDAFYVAEDAKDAKLIANSATTMSKVRKDKTLGVYKKCIVHLTQYAQKNSQVFASIGLYSAEFKPDTEVELPEAVIQFLKDSYLIDNHFDADAISENGNKGVHKSRNVKKYIVELV